MRASKARRHATSDWMDLEKQRGISITSSVMQFPYAGTRFNLLDTPGHQDFSEDTYRTLTAADCAVMLIDVAKGVETQTRKLFQVCRLRNTPIVTFMNKLDRPALEPVALLDELERVLNLRVCAMNWPLGDGPQFKGIFDRLNKQVHFFERVPGGAYRAPEAVLDLSDTGVRERLDEPTHRKVLDELDMLEHAGETFDTAAVLRGELTPVFFGSAVNNFGVQLLLDAFLAHAPSPRPRHSLSLIHI